MERHICNRRSSVVSANYYRDSITPNTALTWKKVENYTELTRQGGNLLQKASNDAVAGSSQVPRDMSQANQPKHAASQDSRYCLLETLVRGRCWTCRGGFVGTSHSRRIGSSPAHVVTGPSTYSEPTGRHPAHPEC